ncbi:MAG: VCBS repeat-containing protein [Desulfobacteraceae bacterium]|jgi:TolB-like protein
MFDLQKRMGLGRAVVVCLVVWLGFNTAYGREPVQPQKILILPPVLHAGQEMDYLRRGIVDMLSGRLRLPGSVEALTLDGAGEQPGTDAAAVAVGRNMGADYVVLESIVVLGDSVSTDARVVSAETGRIAMTFSRTGKSRADIISHIDALAVEINTRLMGRAASPAEAGVGAKAATEAPAKAADIHQHPEKLLGSMGESRQDAWGGDRGGERMDTVRLLMRGRRMDRQIRGVTTGDVDGDGRVDIVCIDGTTVLLYDTEQGQMVKKAEAASGTGNIGVDAMDLNANGRDELFITRFDNDTGRVLSYVLEWEGGKFRRVADNLRWYFRSVDLADRGRVLVGQRQGIDKRFAPGIYEIGYSGGTYDGVQKLNFPRNRMVFGFAQGAVRSAGMADVVDYSRDGYLRVMDQKGAEEWVSSESYGGSANALFFRSEIDPKEKAVLYLPSRVHLADLDGDGLSEIMAVQNDDIAGAFSRTRMFKQGRLVIHKWDQLGITTLWRTRGLSKFIGDFTLADINADGSSEIVAAIVQKQRTVMGPGSSYLAVFSLDKLPAAGRP